jgi:hypothetical protein
LDYYCKRASSSLSQLLQYMDGLKYIGLLGGWPDLGWAIVGPFAHLAQTLLGPPKRSDKFLSFWTKWATDSTTVPHPFTLQLLLHRSDLPQVPESGVHVLTRTTVNELPVRGRRMVPGSRHTVPSRVPSLEASKASDSMHSDTNLRTRRGSPGRNLSPAQSPTVPRPTAKGSGRRKPRSTSSSASCASAARGSHGESSAPAWPLAVAVAAGLHHARGTSKADAPAPVFFYPLAAVRTDDDSVARMCAAAAVQARPTAATSAPRLHALGAWQVVVEREHAVSDRKFAAGGTYGPSAS